MLSVLIDLFHNTGDFGICLGDIGEIGISLTTPSSFSILIKCSFVHTHSVRVTDTFLVKKEHVLSCIYLRFFFGCDLFYNPYPLQFDYCV